MKRHFLVWLTLALLTACGKPSPDKFDDLSLETLDGQEVSLQTYTGKKVFLNFWATWCAPCRAELPSMVQARQVLGDDYVFVLVSDEAAPTLQRFQEQSGLPFVFLRKPTSIKLLGIFSIPQTYLLNEKGEVVNSFSGAYNWSSPEMMKALRGI